MSDRDKAYEEFSAKANYPNQRAAFNAGWHAALEAVRRDYDNLPKLGVTPPAKGET